MGAAHEHHAAAVTLDPVHVNGHIPSQMFPAAAAQRGAPLATGQLLPLTSLKGVRFSGTLSIFLRG